jgi:hypothetical protein
MAQLDQQEVRDLDREIELLRPLEQLQDRLLAWLVHADAKPERLERDRRLA